MPTIMSQYPARYRFAIPSVIGFEPKLTNQ